MTSENTFDPKALVKSNLNAALDAQHPLAVENVARLRRVHPDKSPIELIRYLNKVYIGTVTATGTGAGVAAVVPNGWVQVPAAFADLLAFLEASVLYTLSVAEIHGLDVEDVERRRLLVTSVLLGNTAATSVLEPVIGRAAPYWGKKVVESIPMSAIRSANRSSAHDSSRSTVQSRVSSSSASRLRSSSALPSAVAATPSSVRSS